MNSELKLIFLHVPKTAGRTFESILNRNYPSDAIYDIYGYGSTISHRIEQLKSMDESEQKPLRLVRGHFHFGLHNYLTARSMYITLLRNPIDRIISNYYYISRDKEHPYNPIIREKKLSIKDYVVSGITKDVDNMQVRLISGLEKDYDFGKCPKSMLETAKENMEKNFLFGLTERFDEFLAICSLRFGWRKIWYKRQNVSRNRVPLEDLDPDAVETIREMNQLDMELYRYASLRFEEIRKSNHLRFWSQYGAIRLMNLSYAAYCGLRAWKAGIRGTPSSI